MTKDDQDKPRMSQEGIAHVYAPIDSFADYWDEVLTVQHLLSQGLAHVDFRQETVSFDRVLSVIYEQSEVALWSSLESLVTDLVTNWLIYEPSARNAKEIQKLQFSYAEYEALDAFGRAAAAIKKLDDAIGGPMRHGVGRFEALLAVFDLSGPIDTTVKRSLHEVWAIRNLLAHRRGVVDARFVAQCPHLKATVGAPLLIVTNSYSDHITAGISYTRALIKRVGARMQAIYGARMREIEAEIAEYKRQRDEEK